MKYNDDYTIVAQAKGQEVISYGTFGSYQGDWIMISRDKENYPKAIVTGKHDLLS